MRFHKFLVTRLFSLIFILISCQIQTNGQETGTVLPLPNAAQLAWQEAELGVIFHYDLHVFDDTLYNQAENRINPVLDYNIFSPEKLDTDQWIRAAKAMGAKFALITATHETGFALYQSDVNPYCLKAVKWQNGEGDIVRDFVNSCRKYGIQPGIYIGIRWNAFFGVHNFQVQGKGAFREYRQNYYNTMVEGMVTELCTRYGPLFEIWFDGGADHPERGAPDVLPIVKEYQPQCLFYHNAQLAEARWGGSESGTVPYPCWATFPFPSADGVTYPEVHADNFFLLKHGDPGGAFWMPAMSDAPLRGYNGRHEWFWEPGDEQHLFPVANLVDMFYRSVGHNSTLILGLTPDPDGLLPQPDVKRLAEFGLAMAERFANPKATESGDGYELVIGLQGKESINQVVIQEDIREGERIRQFILEYFAGDTWHSFYEGSCIGHKHIATFDPVIASKFRIRVTKAIAEPKIKSFNLFYFHP